MCVRVLLLLFVLLYSHWQHYEEHMHYSRRPTTGMRIVSRGICGDCAPHCSARVDAVQKRHERELNELEARLSVEHLTAVQTAQLATRQKQAELDAADERSYQVRLYFHVAKKNSY